jgi:hypothetical protein
MAVAFGEDMGATIQDLVDGNVVDFIVPAWRKKKTPGNEATLLRHR